MVASTRFYATLVALIWFQMLTGVWSATVEVKNKCTYTVSPGILSTGGPLLSTTGFTLQEGESITISLPPAWRGRLWGRTLCRHDDVTGRFSCVTGDCGSGTVECTGNSAAPPVTVVEFAMNGPGELDTVVVTVEQGFNVPVIVDAAADGSEWRGCVTNLNDVCPAELRVTVGTDTVACKAHTYNCTTFSDIFKSYCPRIRVCSEDASSGSPPASTRYTVTFCPVNTITSANASWIKSTMKSFSKTVIGVVVFSVLSVIACGVTITIKISRK